MSTWLLSVILTAGLSLSVPTEGTKGQARVGELTNHTGRDIVFSAYMGDDQTPKSTLMSWERWDDVNGVWETPPPFGWCGTGLGEHTLGSGDRVNVYVNAHMKSGTYRYALKYHFAGDPRRAVHTLYSDPVTIE